MHGLKYKKKQRTKRMLNMGKFMNTDKQNNNFCGLKIWKGLKHNNPSKYAYRGENRIQVF